MHIFRSLARTAVAAFALLAVLLLSTSGLAVAQDAARPSSRQTPVVNFGITCPAGQVVTLVPATGGMQCTDTVANSTHSGIAKSLDNAAVVNGAQVSGAVAEAKTVSGGGAGNGAGGACYSNYLGREVANGGSFRMPWGSSSGFGICTCIAGSWSAYNTEGSCS